MEIDEVLRKLKPIVGEAEVRRAWEHLQVVDAKTAKLIEFSLRRRLADATGASFEGGESLFEPIPAEKSGGSIQLGRVMYGEQGLHWFGLRRHELMQHMAILGRSGAGKTSACFVILQVLSRLHIPFLVLDWKKNYRDLLYVHGFDKLVVYTVGRDDVPFYFNPLLPPTGSEPREWIKKLVEIMQHAYFLGEGVAYVLQEVFDAVYREFGIYDGSTTWPTFRDVFRKLHERKVKGREAGWADSAYRALGVLNFGAIDGVLNSGARVPMERVLAQQAVLELDALTNADKTFLIEALLLWIHHFRMNESGREQLKHLLVIEEAHHVLLRKKQELTGAEAVTDVLCREVREFGQAIVTCDQNGSLLSRPSMSNLFCMVSLNTREGSDVAAVGKSMLLEPDQARQLGHLPVGWGIVKLQARWTKPFLVQFPKFEIAKGSVTDAQVRRRFIEHVDAETAAQLMRQGVDAFARLAGAAPPDAPASVKPSIIGAPSSPSTLSADERRLLDDVVAFPTSGVTERYARLRLAPEKGTALVAALVARGLLRRSLISFKGTHVRVLSLTRVGRESLGLPAEQDRLGGPDHRFWIESILGALRATGVAAELEVPLGDGKAADIVAVIRGERVGIEVETGKSDWQANVRKCLTAFGRVIICGTTPDISEAMRREADLVFAGRVRVFHAPEFLAWIERSNLSPDSADSRGF